MIDDVGDIADYYNSDPQREHARLERHQLEYDLTLRCFDRYLPAQGSILEVGAATGRYTLELARRGYRVTAVDLSPVQIEECRQRLMEAGLQGQVRLVVDDARDLSQVPEREFDAVLLMGPFYHLVFAPDRMAALKQAFDRLRAGGILFSAFISRLGILGDLMKKVPDWIEDSVEVQSFLAQGKRPEGYPPGGFRGYFARVDEIAPFHEAAGFEYLRLVGVEPAISADDESYNTLQGKQRQQWLDVLDTVSSEPSILGASRHLLYIGKKR